MNDDEKAITPVPKVGYGSPPKKNQFQKGRSGNPKGRPPATKRAQDIFLEEVYRVIKIEGVSARMPALLAIVRNQFTLGMMGKAQAPHSLFKMLNDLEPRMFELLVEERRKADELRDGKSNEADKEPGDRPPFFTYR